MITSASGYAMMSFRGENTNAVACAAVTGTGARTGPNVNTTIANTTVGDDSARSPHFRKGESRIMTGYISRIVMTGFLLVLCLNLGSISVAGGNRCTDHCADVYKVKRDACRLIPLKTERKICERRAKEAKNDCKHRCR